MSNDPELLLTLILVAAALAVLLFQRRWPGRRGGPPAEIHETPAQPKAPAPPPPCPAPFSGKAWVVDGDTLRVNRARVRLFGMDAPEIGQRGGYPARSHLIRLAGGRQVRVEPVTIDIHGRTVARVWLGETDLSRRMVRDGYAVATARWDLDYVPDEEAARRERRGLWQADPRNGIRDPAAHRRWQARQRQRQSGGPGGGPA